MRACMAKYSQACQDGTRQEARELAGRSEVNGRDGRSIECARDRVNVLTDQRWLTMTMFSSVWPSTISASVISNHMIPPSAITFRNSGMGSLDFQLSTASRVTTAHLPGCRSELL